MKKPEHWAGQHQKACPSKRFAKTLWHRGARRQAKRDPENAPRKIRFYGYVT